MISEDPKHWFGVVKKTEVKQATELFEPETLYDPRVRKAQQFLAGDYAIEMCGQYHGVRRHDFREVYIPTAKSWVEVEQQETPSDKLLLKLLLDNVIKLRNEIHDMRQCEQIDRKV